MSAFMDMWKCSFDPHSIYIRDKEDEIIENMNEVLRLEEQLRRKIGAKDFNLVQNIIRRRLIVSECYQYDSFKRGFIMGMKLRKDIDEFENIDNVKEINEKINKLKKELETIK